MNRRRSLPEEIGAWVEIVVQDNADDLLRYLAHRVSPREDAADLLGKVLLILWEKGARVPTTDEAARMWCFGIARNVLREHRRHALKSLDLADALRAHLQHTAPLIDSAETIVETAMRADDVRVALGHLDERARELLMLIYWDDFTIAEAARLLHLNESTARTRHMRALRRLEAALEAAVRRVHNSSRLASPGGAHHALARGGTRATPASEEL
ncbi:MAG: sigma-70 family RNA polymerase sigma factor [Candidatus Microbacterium colombiense]|nr:MAG: sigma-70 family RNA polymerase sigma factor [Microbacterium sp.]